MTLSKAALTSMAIASIEAMIFFLRGQRVMLDADLAILYGVETRELLQAMKRNQERFPNDFMFTLTDSEFANLRSQFVMSRWGGRRHLPYAFTEQGVAMLSTVLKSSKAIRVNIEIMRAFVRLRQLIGSHGELAQQIGELEKKVKSQDGEIKVIFATINTMLHPVTKRKPQIGFQDEKPNKV